MITLAHVRRLNRFVKSQERKALKRKMDGYNSLAAKAAPRVVDKHSPDTLQDISESLCDAMREHTYTRSSHVTRSTRADDIVNHVVSDEVRATWHARIGLVSLLSDANREELRHMSHGDIRNARLNDLAKWMVTQWCDVEGYDPAKHASRKRT